jgi:hypothetical protein
MNARSVQGNSPGEINTALETCMAEGYQSNLAIVFISDKQNRKTVSDQFTLSRIQAMGATSSSEITVGQERAGEIPMIFSGIKKSDYSILSSDGKVMKGEALERSIESLVSPRVNMFGVSN